MNLFCNFLENENHAHFLSVESEEVEKNEEIYLKTQ